MYARLLFVVVGIFGVRLGRVILPPEFLLRTLASPDSIGYTLAA